MVNVNKANLKSKKFNKAPNKHKNAIDSKRVRTTYKKSSFKKSNEVEKKQKVNKIEERKALRAQKQKALEEERAKAKLEKEERIRQYKKKRLEKTKAISKRTQRGQPLMKDRMQLLLKQIQEMKRK